MSRARDGIERADPLVVSDVRAVGLRLLSPVPREDGSQHEGEGIRGQVPRSSPGPLPAMSIASSQLPCFQQLQVHPRREGPGRNRPESGNPRGTRGEPGVDAGLAPDVPCRALDAAVAQLAER